MDRQASRGTRADGSRHHRPREISEDLVLACFGAAGVELFEYQMSVTVKKVAV
jgi:hypothetical protein